MFIVLKIVFRPRLFLDFDFVKSFFQALFLLFLTVFIYYI